MSRMDRGEFIDCQFEEVVAGWQKTQKDSLEPAWWQRLFQRMPKPAITDAEVNAGWLKMEKKSLQPAWWQRIFFWLSVPD